MIETIHKFNHWLYWHKLKTVSQVIRSINRMIFCCDIHPEAVLGKDTHIHHRVGTVIGKGVKIGDNCNIYHNVTLGNVNGLFPIINDNVTIFCHCLILGNVNILSNTLIKAGSQIINPNTKVMVI